MARELHALVRECLMVVNDLTLGEAVVQVLLGVEGLVVRIAHADVVLEQAPQQRLGGVCHVHGPREGRAFGEVGQRCAVVEVQVRHEHQVNGVQLDEVEEREPVCAAAAGMHANVQEDLAVAVAQVVTRASHFPTGAKRRDDQLVRVHGIRWSSSWWWWWWRRRRRTVATSSSAATLATAASAAGSSTARVTVPMTQSATMSASGPALQDTSATSGSGALAPPAPPPLPAAAASDTERRRTTRPCTLTSYTSVSFGPAPTCRSATTASKTCRRSRMRAVGEPWHRRRTRCCTRPHTSGVYAPSSSAATTRASKSSCTSSDGSGSASPASAALAQLPSALATRGLSGTRKMTGCPSAGMDTSVGALPKARQSLSWRRSICLASPCTSTTWSALTPCMKPRFWL
mmetsp:Transcript_7647/g.25907  ORF Transcript_7647/g.25907 Transcript_7647/m.25907 type:complete len:402 (+) Transcript_7647:1189-2394(+)